MARTTNRLSALDVKRLATPGYYADGGGLYLQISGVGTKSWIYRFKLHKTREMGLGPLAAVSLKDAREAAQEARKLVARGVDPIDHRQAQKAARAVADTSRKTFKQCAEMCIRALEPEWRNKKHGDQWRNTLKRYVYPTIGDLPVDAIEVEHVYSILEPIWTTKNETASRVRGRIERVLSWAAARGFRTKDNPAQWRGHLDQLLARPSKIKKVRHHPCVPYEQVGAFMEQLKERPGIVSAALEFVVLTAARVSEGVRARWSEIDMECALWTVPANRMKAGREHRVPLSPRAIAILKRVAEAKEESGYVFPSPTRSGKPITDAALLAIVKEIAGEQGTTHGFRSTFSDWARERTNYPNILAKLARAHATADKTEAAYERRDMLEKRRKMMADWARFCSTAAARKADNVHPLRKAAQ